MIQSLHSETIRLYPLNSSSSTYSMEIISHVSFADLPTATCYLLLFKIILHKLELSLMGVVNDHHNRYLVLHRGIEIEFTFGVGLAFQ